MTDKHIEDHDRHWDEALRRSVPRMDLPTPSRLQQARWKQAPSRWSGGRLYRFLTRSGVVAAAIGIIVIVSMNLTARPLSARVIFDELRAALNGSMLLTFEGIDIDFSRLNYRHTDRQVSFDGQIFADAVDQRRAFLELALQVNPTGEEQPEVDFHIVVSAVPDAEWGYVRVNEMPDPVFKDNPRLKVLAELSRRGLYLDMAGMLDEQLHGGGIPDFGLRDVLKLRDRIGTDRLLQFVQEYARDATPQFREDGLVILTASGFYDRLVQSRVFEGLGPELQLFISEIIKDVSLEVAYHPDSGVQWLRIDHFGHGDGTILLQLAEPGFDEVLLDKGHHYSQRQAPELNLRKLRSAGSFVGGLVTSIGVVSTATDDDDVNSSEQPPR